MDANKMDAKTWMPKNAAAKALSRFCRGEFPYLALATGMYYMDAKKWMPTKTS